MHMVNAKKLWTVEEVQALPSDGNRYEVIDGELLVSPAPTFRHQRALRDLFIAVHEYCRTNRCGSVFFAPLDVVYGPRTMVEPDLLVLPLVNGREPDSVEESGGLILVVEVLSPSTARTDRWRKRLLYQRQQVPVYLVVDCDARIVERWCPGDERPEVLAERLEWRATEGVAPLIIELGPFFATIEGEIR